MALAFFRGDEKLQVLRCLRDGLTGLSSCQMAVVGFLFYTLRQTKIAMENGPGLKLEMGIFHCYVRLPEGRWWARVFVMNERPLSGGVSK